MPLLTKVGGVLGLELQENGYGEKDNMHSGADIVGGLIGSCRNDTAQLGTRVTIALDTEPLFYVLGGNDGFARNHYVQSKSNCTIQHFYMNVINTLFERASQSGELNLVLQKERFIQDASKIRLLTFCAQCLAQVQRPWSTEATKLPAAIATTGSPFTMRRERKTETHSMKGNK